MDLKDTLAPAQAARSRDASRISGARRHDKTNAPPGVEVRRRDFHKIETSLELVAMGAQVWRALWATAGATAQQVVPVTGT
jgi:hypothetical protein